MRPQARRSLPEHASNLFRDRLLSVMDRKDHPSYWRLMGPGTSRRQLFTHYVQEWGVYVRDFPVMLSRVHGRCPDLDVRRELAENLYEEETGRISGGGPHGALFLHMMEGLGFPMEAFERPRLLPASRAYRAFLDEATASAPWVVSLAVVTIFVEGSRNDRFEISGKREKQNGQEPVERDPLVVNHGLDPRYLELKRVHRKVEGGHRLSAWRAVLEHARTAQARSAVGSALERALKLWLAYREGVARAARLR
jgi:pyrroloquinoline-quinone synthase